MRKTWKWIICILLVISCVSLSIIFKVYSDIKSTAEEVYTPFHEEEKSEKRIQAIDVSEKEPFSVLILGVDEREGDVGRSDTMIVITVNPSLNSSYMLSIPRDTYTEIVGTNRKDKINHAYAFGGMKMSIKTVENLLDIPIDYAAKVNMEGFIDIIDLVGGITVNNEFEFTYEGEDFPSELDLEGERALKYVRMRYEDPNGDFGRQNRQKQVIQEVIKESISLKTVMNYQSIFAAVEENVDINVPFDDLLDIRKNYSTSFETIEPLYMNNGTGSKMEGIYYYIPEESELKEIQQNLKEHLRI